MEPFEGLDFYNIESLLTEEEIMVRDMVREWVDEAVIPKIEQACEEGVFLDEWRGPRRNGCARRPTERLRLPRSFLRCLRPYLSGIGARRQRSALVCVRSRVLAMYPIWDFGTEEQKEKYLPKMASGEWIGCFGLTEPDYGSNPEDMVTKVEDKGDHYLLNGAKMWITNGTIADLAVVWAKLDGVIRGFIVEKGDEGYSAPEMKGKHSLKASVTSELVFQDCKIPKDRMLPGQRPSRSVLLPEQRSLRYFLVVLARPWRASTVPRPTPFLASSSTTPSHPTNSCRTNWRGCCVRSRRANCSLTTSAKRRMTAPIP